jgi:hypothetical protein
MRSSLSSMSWGRGRNNWRGKIPQDFGGLRDWLLSKIKVKAVFFSRNTFLTDYSQQSSLILLIINKGSLCPK